MGYRYQNKLDERNEKDYYRNLSSYQRRQLMRHYLRLLLIAVCILYLIVR